MYTSHFRGYTMACMMACQMETEIGVHARMCTTNLPEMLFKEDLVGNHCSRTSVANRSLGPGRLASAAVDHHGLG